MIAGRTGRQPAGIGRCRFRSSSTTSVVNMLTSFTRGDGMSIAELYELSVNELGKLGLGAYAKPDCDSVKISQSSKTGSVGYATPSLNRIMTNVHRPGSALTTS